MGYGAVTKGTKCSSIPFTTSCFDIVLLQETDQLLCMCLNGNVAQHALVEVGMQ